MLAYIDGKFLDCEMNEMERSKVSLEGKGRLVVLRCVL